MVLPASPSSEHNALPPPKRKREDDDDTGGRSKRLKPPSPPPSLERLTDSPQHEYSVCNRALATAAWILETASTAMPPEPPVLPSEAAQSEAASTTTRASSRSRIVPTKAYRGLIKKAGIVPDTWKEMPSSMQDTVNTILATAPSCESAPDLSSIATKFSHRFRELADDDANESGWRGAVQAMVDDLRLGRAADDLKLASDQDWCEEVLPQVQRPAQVIPQRRGHGSLGDASAASGLLLSVKLKKPRPDVQLSLSESALGGRAQADLLDLLFESAGFISNPSRQPESGHFPFLICEVKSGATGGNLFGAQNQACVAAAAALRILNDLQDLCPPGNNEDYTSLPVFAICSESSRLELFAYYHDLEERKFIGRRLRLWDPTRKEETSDLVRSVASIVDWAKDSLKSKLVRALDKITRQQSNPSLDPQSVHITTNTTNTS